MILYNYYFTSECDNWLHVFAWLHTEAFHLVFVCSSWKWNTIKVIRDTSAARGEYNYYCPLRRDMMKFMTYKKEVY